ncbi:hypothetical protein ACFQLX_05850 [Streptomyces polyrhachis]|uniref:Uncharacterized protein n=1 Tax=Streptomyces polyrhachis TaxID=1282885 RepID=A0ABW2GD35_9ACTN
MLDVRVPICAGLPAALITDPVVVALVQVSWIPPEVQTTLPELTIFTGSGVGELGVTFQVVAANGAALAGAASARAAAPAANTVATRSAVAANLGLDIKPFTPWV